MQVDRRHLAGLELALSVADTVCTDSINVGQLERLIEQAKAGPPPCDLHGQRDKQSNPAGVVVPHDFFNQIIAEWEHDNDKYLLARQLRALLANSEGVKP